MSVDRDKGIGEDCGRLVEFIHHLEIAYRNFGGVGLMGQCVTGGLTTVEIRTSGQLRTVEGNTTIFSGASGLGGS